MRKVLLSLSATALACVVAVPAQAVANLPVATWEMNEAPGASVMVDSSSNHLDGAIGSEVQTGIEVLSPTGTEVQTGMEVPPATGYRFERLRPNTPPSRPQHIVVVPHHDLLNPGAREFTIEARYRTTNPFGNLVQKGQAGARGGYFKIQLPQGEPSCLFRGATGITNAIRAKTRIDDGLWHTIRCERTASAVALYVDGVYVGRNTGTTGPISNAEPIYIGGKGYCDQVSITCDYFGGDIDYITLRSS